MPDNRSSCEAKSKIFVLKTLSSSTFRRAQAQQLQKELDSLALLLAEVKKQTEKVEAAADAIGDALISHLEIDEAAIHGRRREVRAQEVIDS